MARIVFAAAVSHTAQMIRSVDALDPVQRQDIFAAWETLRNSLEDAQPDVLIVASSEHFKSFHMDNMPAFCVGLGERTRSWGEAGVPKYEIPLHAKFSQYLLEGLLESGVDVSYSRDLPLDHGFACPLHFLSPRMTLPVVPIFVNCYAPPLPTMPRCAVFGATLKKIVEQAEAVARVAIVGTGGLSHFLPAPRFGAGVNDDDKLMIEAMTHRGKDELFSEILWRRAKIMAETGAARVDEQFDHEVLRSLGAGNIEELAARGTDWVEENGGNGGQEIRNWIIAAAAAGGRPSRVLTYHPVRRWLTGIGFMQWQL